MGMAAGPLLGGILVSLADWRAVFAVNVVIGIPAIAWTIRSTPATPRRNRRLDYAGMSTATVLIGGLVFGLVEAPAKGWANPGVLTAFALTIVGVIGFIQAERTAKTPLLPTGVYSDRSFITSALQGALFNFTFYGLLFAMSLMLQQGRGLSAIESGLLFLPLTGLISVGNLCAASLARRFGRRVVLGTAELILTTGLVAVALTSTLGPLWPLVIALLPSGFSAGVLVPTMTSQSISAVRPALHGTASAVFNTSRQIGAAIGIATFGPLLGTTSALRDGFITCVLVAAAATIGSLLLTLINRPARTPPYVCANPTNARVS
jgi:MFS transporter, DHA2 family, methylenomycin A resistance protein